MKTAWIAIIVGVIMLLGVLVNNYKPSTDATGTSGTSSNSGGGGGSSNSGGSTNSTSSSTPSPGSSTSSARTTFNLLVGTTKTIKRAEYAFKIAAGKGDLTNLVELMIPGKTVYNTIMFSNDSGVALLSTDTTSSLATITNTGTTPRGSDTPAVAGLKFAFSPDSTKYYVLGNGTDRKQLSTSNNTVSATVSTYSKKSNPIADTAVAVNAAGDLVIFANSVKKLVFHHTSDFAKPRVYDGGFTTTPIALACSPSQNHLIVALANASSGQTRLKCISFASNASDIGVATKDVWTLAPTEIFQADKVVYINPSTAVYARKSGTASTFGDIGIVFNADTSTPVHRSFSLLTEVAKQVPLVENRSRTNDISVLAPSGDPNIFFIGTTDGKVYLCYLKPSSSTDATFSVIVTNVDTSTFDRITAITSSLAK